MFNIYYIDICIYTIKGILGIKIGTEKTENSAQMLG